MSGDSNRGMKIALVIVAFGLGLLAYHGQPCKTKVIVAKITETEPGSPGQGLSVRFKVDEFPQIEFTNRVNFRGDEKRLEQIVVGATIRFEVCEGVDLKNPKPHEKFCNSPVEIIAPPPP